MDYKGQADLMRRDAEEFDGPGYIIGDLRNAATAITDLLARAEAVEQQCETLEKIVKEYQEELIPGYRDRAEKAERERDRYKNFFVDVSEKPGCNTCNDIKCEFRPKPGEITRFNCPLWRGQKEE